MPTNTQPGNIKFVDLEAQQIVDLAKRIDLDIKRENPFAEYFDKRTWPTGKAAVQYRVLIPSEQIKKGEEANYVLREEVAPDYGRLAYATFSFATKSYGYKFKYTWRAVEESADDVVADAASELAQWGVDLKAIVEGTALISSANVYDCPASGTTRIMTICKNVQMIFRRLHCKPWSGGNYRCLCTAEVIDKLGEEYFSTSNGALPQAKADQALQGFLNEWEHITFIDPDCDEIMLTRSGGDVTYFNMIFIARTPKGQKPAILYDGGSGEVIHNPLGTGVIEDKNGKITADDNKQVGSIAMNIKRFSAHIVDDRAIITVAVPASYITLDPDTVMNLPVHDVASLVEERQKYPAKYGYEYESDGSVPSTARSVEGIEADDSVSPTAPVIAYIGSSTATPPQENVDNGDDYAVMYKANNNGIVCTKDCVAKWYSNSACTTETTSPVTAGKFVNTGSSDITVYQKVTYKDATALVIKFVVAHA